MTINGSENRSNTFHVKYCLQGKKKFVNKDGQKFYLLHRSQTDEAYAGDEKPSDFVLVPAKDVRYHANRMSFIFL